MSQITKPIILDETGQDIATAISSLANRANDIENFTSSDVADGSATAWTSVTPLASGEVHSSIFAKISQMFKNIRYLYKMLGTTNISSIGGGTVTGAISTLNSKFTGTNIPNNSDLNDYTDVGKYYTGSSSATATIVNKPSDLTSAFVMEVQLRGGYLNQIIYDYGGKMYIRGKVSSGWQSWYKFTGTSV